MNPYLGLSSYFFYDFITFNITQHITGLGISAIPGVSFNMNEHLMLEFNIPFQIYEIYYIRVKDFDPIFPRSESVSGNIENIFFPVKYQFRLGLVYNIMK